MLALHNYHDAHGHFPADVRDKDGKPLLSWRVQILPYLEQERLYKQFKLDEPWDSEHNKKLIDKMPKTLRSPRQAAALTDRTDYLAPLGPGLVLGRPEGDEDHRRSRTGRRTRSPWSRRTTTGRWSGRSRRTSRSTRRNPVTGLLGHYADGFQAAMADGSVRFFKKGIEPTTLWALFTRAGGEVVDK